MCFTSFKDQFNPRKCKVKNFEVANSTVCAIFTLCHCKDLANGRSRFRVNGLNRFEYATLKKKISSQKYPDTCGRDLNLMLFDVFIGPNS